MEDGRRARGAASRDALIAAVLVVLEREGPQGVTQRAVAAQAGLAAHSVTYHFGSMEELYLSAIKAGTSSWTAALANVARDTFARDLAEHLVREADEHRPRLVAEIELYLLAARRPALRPAARQWAGTMIASLGDLDETHRRQLIAAIDGICIQLLLEDDPITVDVVERIIQSALPAVIHD